MPLIFNRTIAPESFIGVWHLTEDALWMVRHLDLHPEDEQIFRSIRNENRKLQWLGCRMVLSHLLNTQVVSIRYTDFGKPLLDSARAEISFTHSGPYAAAICSFNSSVGIDLEQVRERINRVADRFLSPEEIILVSGPDRLEVLTLFWAAKESLYKINGSPDIDIQHDLCIERFDYLCGTDGDLNTRIKRPGSVTRLKVSYHRLGDFILAWAMTPGKN